ncbi:hypothetical protein BKA70DRAFT_1261966 [Coprinopsis sp. MPI-PUGE-AT-0042]|nr:hypothetical protein BKA70DRAFT_1261966 [Coprinopsis sp. MPI-PUGE-AT-0042]
MILKPVHHPAPPPKHEPSPIHHTTSTVHHVPIYTPPVHHIPPPVHHTTSTIHHVPIYTPPVHHIPPPVHHTTSTLHHIPIYTPIKHELPVHHTTTLEHIPVHTPTPIHHIPPPVHTTPVHHVQPPVHTPPAHVPVHVPTYHSFDKWDGHESLKGFDNFYGVDNWDGYKFEQVFVKKEHELVCRTHDIHIIQQRLLVLQEMAKKIVVETICEVEVQTIVFEQFYAGLNGFGRDIRHVPGNHQVGYDEEIVKHFPKIIKHDGSLDVEDWKFTGKDLGKHTVIVKGHNWDDKRSYGSVWKAWGAARKGWFDLYGKWF